MTSFQTIKAEMLAYADSILASGETIITTPMAKEITERITGFRQSFEAIDLHPSRIEVITATDRAEIVKKIDAIGNLFQSRLTISDTLVNLYNAVPYMRDAIDRLIDHSEASSIKDLGKLAQELESCVTETSTRISEQVMKYRNGPLTVHRAKGIIEIVTTLLSAQNIQASKVNYQLDQYVRIVSNWMNTNTYPQDFLIEVQEMIVRVRAVLEKCPILLNHESANLNSALDQLQGQTCAPTTLTEPDYCKHGNQMLLHFQTLDPYVSELQKELDDADFPLSILLYNLYRLKKLERQTDEMLKALPKQVGAAIKAQRKYIKAIRSIAPTLHDPEAQKTLAKHRYTLTHLNQLSHHPSYLRVKAFLAQLSSHPKTAAIYRSAELTTPLTIPSKYWLLESLQLPSLQDIAALDEILEKYSRFFFGAPSGSQSNPRTEPRLNKTNPLRPLQNLDELISKLILC